MTTPIAEEALPGQLGDFLIVGVLGTGGSGVVLDARWGHREIALKVLHPTLIPTARERAQFLEEARRLQDISHPGVVKVLASGELPDGRPYLAMEKLAGPTLAAKLAGGALPLTRALALFEQLAGAVQALHERGLVHRDLKPENVVLVGDAHAVLLDFGIAKSLAAPASTTTQDGGVRGTPAYMAPERFFGQPASISTDVYELAVTLYAMLAGRLPWADCGDPDVRLNPASLGAGVPEDLDVEIRRALSTRAANRPTSVRELAIAVLAAGGMPTGPVSARTTAQVPLDISRPAPAWFDHGATGDSANSKGSTPLAWAPTARQAAKELPAEPRGRRLWWVLAAVLGGGMFIAVIAYLATRKMPGNDGDDDVTEASSGSGSGSSTATKDDPWASRVRDETPTTSANTPAPLPRPASELRAEMAAAVGKLPADTRTVLALGIAEMRADPDFASLIAAAVKRPELTLLFGKSEGCPIGIADIDWVVLGFPEAGVHREGDMLIRGRWTDAQLETCLAALAGGAKPAVDPGTGMVHIDGTGTDYWFGTEGSVSAISSRDKASAAHVKAMLARTEGPGGPTGALVAQLDRNATLWFVLDADPGDDLEALDIPAGGDVGVWARIDNGLRGVILGRMKSEADAKKAEATMRVEIDKLMKEGIDLIGKFEVARTGTDVTLTLWFAPLTMTVVTGEILKGLE